MNALVFIALATQAVMQEFTSPATETPEFGYNLSQDDALAGWIALFDGKTVFGWADGRVNDGALVGGKTMTTFGPCELKGAAASDGTIRVGEQQQAVKQGDFKVKFPDAGGRITLDKGLELKSLSLKPLMLRALFNGRDLTGWTVLRHKQLPEERQTKWTVTEGAIRCVGGSGALELDGRYGDFVMQMTAKMLKPLSNGGVFFRSIPGDFMNGYEAQLFNGCYDHDPAKPARYGTGAIDDRQNARRLVSRDSEPFTMTVIAVGPHLSTWVNGFQTTDWTDKRAEHENPREGLRTKAGTIQLQAHDAATQIEYRSIMIGELK
jgi:hypothetical protein